ncbi:hypothetical protein KOW79_013659 [Hemibagrus wyckioides]|uniref:Secreted protein n=1 Tax=Hemibagrus wyckioides TaxID=337641 RepID=A0A9D3NG60_9TELE|nr:hypothetical protein KOW79_013659 [Hemibagrus wyckioides]
MFKLVVYFLIFTKKAWAPIKWGDCPAGISRVTREQERESFDLLLLVTDLSWCMYICPLLDLSLVHYGSYIVHGVCSPLVDGSDGHH